jgi:hypothetical protein
MKWAELTFKAFWGSEIVLVSRMQYHEYK